MMNKASAKLRRRTWTNYLYLMPAAILIGAYFITSIIYTFWLSFQKADGFSAPVFVGFENYIYLFKDPNFATSLTNTLVWVLSSLIISVVLPLFLAILITKSLHTTLFKNIFYFPNVLAGTIAGIIFRSMISLYALPQLFGFIGLESWVVDWLAVPKLNTFIMILSSVWQGIGMNLLLFIVGLNTMDASPIEAATIDGAGTIDMYGKVIFPLLKPTTTVILLMTLVNSFKVFDSIWVMTKGGPYRSSETLALTMYEESFIRNNLGLGAAVAVVLTIIIMFVSYFNIRNTFKSNRSK